MDNFDNFLILFEKYQRSKKYLWKKVGRNQCIAEDIPKMIEKVINPLEVAVDALEPEEFYQTWRFIDEWNSHIILGDWRDHVL